MIAFDLVKSLAQSHPTPFEFNVHHRQTVHQDGHIIAAQTFAALFFILVEHLQAIVVDGRFVDKADVHHAAVIAFQQLDVVDLDFAGLVEDALFGVRQTVMKEVLPLVFGKAHFVEQFQLQAQVVDQRLFVFDTDVLITLVLQRLDEGTLQLRFALVILSVIRRGFILGNDGGLGCAGNNVVKAHRWLRVRRGV